MPRLKKTPVPQDNLLLLPLRLLSVEQVAYLLGISNKTVLRYARGYRQGSKRIPAILECVKLKAGIRFRPASVERFIRAHTIATGQRVVSVDGE